MVKKLKISVIVQARLDSSRLPEKILKKIKNVIALEINTNEKFEITGKEALKVHYLIDAMIESSKKNILISME